MPASTFPAAPNDPFTRSLGSRAPASPFRVGDGLSPPVMVGRDRHLAEVAELVRALGEQRPTPMFGLHGPSGIGKTSLLASIEAEVVARGGVVARIDGRDRDDGLVSLANAHQRILAAAPDNIPSRDAYDTIAGHYRAASDVASATNRPFLVLVDNLHVASDLTEHLGSSYKAGGAVVMAGAHDHARLKDMPPGTRSMSVGYLQPGEAIDAITSPLESYDIEVDDRLVSAAAARSGGLPLAVQAWGDELWRAAHEDRLGLGIEDLTRRVDAQLGRHYSTIWVGLSNAERHYVQALARPFGGGMSAGMVAKLAGYPASQNASPMRSQLLDQGIVTVPQYGHVEVSIAGLGRWRTQQASALNASTTASPRVAATRDQHGLAAEQVTPYQPASAPRK